MELKAYIHTTCPYSRKLLETLEKTGFKEVTQVINTADHPFSPLKDGVLSVPVLFAGENMIVSGSFDTEWLEKYLSLFLPHLPDAEETFRLFISAALDNISTASFLYLYPEKVEAILENSDYLLTTTKLFRVVRPSDGEILQHIREVVTVTLPGFMQEKQHLFHKIIAVNYLRDLYWSGQLVADGSSPHFPENIPEDFPRWLFTRSATGRMGIDPLAPPENLREKAGRVWDYLREHYAEFAETIIRTARIQD